VATAGQPGSGQITITPASQTPSTVNLSMVAPVISGYTISLSSQQVSLNGSPVAVNLVLTPTTSAYSNVIRTQIRHAGFLSIQRGNWWLLSLITALAVLFLVTLPKRRRRARAVLSLSVISVLFFVFGCGGGGSSSGGGGGGTSGPQPTSITLTTSNAKVAQNTQFAITATVTASKPLTGTINFYNFGSPIVSGIPPSNNQAQTGSGYLNNPGLYQVTASYSGDSENQASTSSPLTQVITGTMPITIQGTTGADSHLIQGTVGLQ
jgi:hypothetical protein